MHLLAATLLAHPSGEQLFMLLDRMVRAMGSVPQSQTTMSAMLTMLATSAVFLFDGGCAVALLFILVCGVALLQSRLIKAAGHWTQHCASAIQLNNSRNMSRTCTSAAELFYLRHTRSCAATACGNKGGGTSHSISLQMSGADFIARLLQSVCQQVCLTIIMHWGRVLLALFRPSARLLQSILRRCYVTVILPLVRLLQSIAQIVLFDMNGLHWPPKSSIENQQLFNRILMKTCKNHDFFNAKPLSTPARRPPQEGP